jgi:hypothetical protein
MFQYHGGGLMPGWIGLATVLTIAVALAHFAPNSFEIRHEWHPAWSTAFCGSLSAVPDRDCRSQSISVPVFPVLKGAS